LPPLAVVTDVINFTAGWTGFLICRPGDELVVRLEATLAAAANMDIWATRCPFAV
jgi:hypothetical protein